MIFHLSLSWVSSQYSSDGLVSWTSWRSACRSGGIGTWPLPYGSSQCACQGCLFMRTSFGSIRRRRASLEYEFLSDQSTYSSRISKNCTPWSYHCRLIRGGCTRRSWTSCSGCSTLRKSKLCSLWIQIS